MYVYVYIYVYIYTIYYDWILTDTTSLIDWNGLGLGRLSQNGQSIQVNRRSVHLYM